MYYASIVFLLCFCENLLQRSNFHILDFIFCGFMKNNTNFLSPCQRHQFFVVLLKQRRMPIFTRIAFQFVFCLFVKIYNNWVISYITLQLLLFLKNNTICVFFMYLTYYCGFQKTAKDCFLLCTNLHFDFFFTFVNVNNDGVISTCWSLYFVVLWKTIEIFFFHGENINLCGFVEATKHVIFSIYYTLIGFLCFC